MKKQKIANYLKTGILLFGVSVLLWNCEKITETDLEHAHQEVSKPKIITLDLEKAKKIPDFMEISNKFKTSYLFDKEIVKDGFKSKSKPKDEFTIDFNEFKRIEFEGLITYTFILKRTANKDNDITENLIIEKRGDEIKGYIIKYSEASYFEKDNHKYLRAKILKTSYKGNLEDLLNKVDSNLLPIAPAACIPEIVASVRVCSVHGAFSQHEDCINYINQTYWNYTLIPCSTDGFGTGDFTDFDGGGDYNGGNGGTGTGFTTPIFPCGDSVHGCDKDAAGYILHYVEGLTSDQKYWVDNNIDFATAKDIQTFLTNEQNSVIAQSFVKEAINALENNGEIDLDNRLIYNPIIAEDYKTKMSPAEVVIFETLNAPTKLLYLKAATNAYIYAETHFPRPVRNTKGET